MDFNYNDDDDAKYQQHKSPTNGENSEGAASGNGAVAPLETEAPAAATGGGGAQLTNLSMPKKKSSILGASSNLVNSIVGAGIIGE